MNARRRIWTLVAAVAFGSACVTAALASVQLSAGIRYVSPTGTLADCSTKAQAALNAFLPGATESTSGSGEWISSGQNVLTGAATVAATVRCFALPRGYVATFTCAAQLPANPYPAGPLCLNIAHTFYGGAITPLAAMPTATPIPTGCAVTNLVGDWTSDDKPGLELKMALDGGVTDSDGVSGNWNLDGTTVTLTYYGTHTLTLSSDGKHMHGSGYNFTRKC